MNKVAVVTGGSSGIGKCTVDALLAKGYSVYELSRRDNHRNDLCHIHTDVTDETTVKQAIAEVLMQAEKIDVLINCAGFGISGAAEFTELADAKHQLDVNFFGTVNTCKAVLPIMREQKHGKIINISSVAAPVAIPFQAFYSASKAAINDFSCALANEVRPYGVFVTAIQPGDIKTGFTAAREKSIVGDDVYGGRISRSVSLMEHDEQNGMKPEVAGRYIAKIADKKRLKPIYTIGFSYKLICLVCKLLPCGLQNRIVGLLYAK